MEKSPTMYETGIDHEVLEVTATRVNEGFGFGEGGISHAENKALLQLGEADRAATIAEVTAAIGSPRILVKVDTDKTGKMLDDDGCGDGRGVMAIFEGNETRAKSLNRPKVFGGGVAAVTSALVGLGLAKGQTMNQAFANGIARLTDKQVGFGAHTDVKNKDGNNSGCGAIDKAPRAYQNVITYQDEIHQTITSLGIDTTGIDTIFDNMREFAGAISDQEFAGRAVIDEVKYNGKVIKELSQDHLELYVLLNMVEGRTVDQSLIRAVSADKAQVFAVDVWRMQQIADKAFDTPEQRQQAFLSNLIYTLGVSATLTQGDLPTYVISE